MQHFCLVHLTNADLFKQSNLDLEIQSSLCRKAEIFVCEALAGISLSPSKLRNNVADLTLCKILHFMSIMVMNISSPSEYQPVSTGIREGIYTICPKWNSRKKHPAGPASL